MLGCTGHEPVLVFLIGVAPKSVYLLLDCSNSCNYAVIIYTTCHLA